KLIFNVKKVYVVASLALTVLISSCGTIIHGSRQDVSISSNPSSALITINNQELGRTPLTTSLSRKDSHVVRIELDGYLPYETKFTRKVDGWIAGNIIFGGIIGLAVDAISGGMYKLTPDQIQAELRNSTASVRQLKDGVYFSVVLQPNSDWEKIGEFTKIR